MTQNRNIRLAAIGTAVALSVSVGLPAHADNGTGTGALREAVTASGIIEHLQALQDIADAHGGTRASGTPGYEASAVYVEEQLRAAGYTPTRQPYSYEQFVMNAESFAQLAPTPTTYLGGTDFATMSYSGSGLVDATVQAVDINLGGDRASTSGCEAADFAGFTPGNVALIQRGTCTFQVKAENAIAAGAAGVIIFNQGNADDRLGLLNGTLDAPQASVPVIGTSFALGEALAGQPAPSVRLAVDAEVIVTESFNILADTAGRADRTVVAGAHLDSVAEGAGINDNGSGSAAILETAIQLAASGDAPTNRVRFAFWGSEEDGLVGSEYYVSQLTKRQIKEHAVNLNFDMVASPNFVRFVYDGDGSSFGTTGPNGSARVEKVFLDYFASQGLAVEPTEFDGRSDYFGFIENGIPAGGLFTGAEDLMTDAQAVTYGGVAGAPYDACYHAACDDITNINAVVLEQMADAIAHATKTFGETTSAVNGTTRGGGSGTMDLQFKGSHATK
ncbi:M20/M25/M40 family metallo-hydrolase [Cryobacterium sinapicolor]|uniref:M20/M25/M40 family metallo-hydrolase n=1 Tax=Cryobacterium sinapicolor TaxID=1259236 RepID=A0ABY2IY52_9MICO|nr:MULTISPECIES: M20/M25/M40 family metallo-hydrolase [Cryobacterium]TFC93471.1 M20/M25/M40 family metallo-hydrolase [Cryobacterium sp. TMT3-29-2]TFC95515.1 M20/M25/M40 family metallo-hydrolase [Cryobacterium sinapicolor]